MGDPPGWLPHYPSFLNVQAALREVSECIAGLLGGEVKSRVSISLPEWPYQYSNGISFRDHTSGIVLGGASCTVSQTTYSEEKIVECLEQAADAACLMAAMVEGITPAVLLYLTAHRHCNRHADCEDADILARVKGYHGASHCVMHEVDESFRVDGALVFDPHRGESR